MAYQIPPPTAHFVDRADEQTRAARAVAEWDPGQPGPLCLALSGLGGTGKTELALRLVRALRERYPDGILYVDLDDMRRDGVVEVADALGELLRPLVGADAVEPSLRARRKQFWTCTDGKRLIVVVDNARYGSEVLPLLPASGASLTVVTSHGPLHDLEREAAVELALPPLDDGHAMELLEHVTSGDARLAAEPDAARGFLGLCSGLPAALHVAARLIRRRGRPSLSRLLSELTAELHEQGLPLVERVWDAAYRELGPDAAALYRLLAGCPGPSFTSETATALLGQGRDAADDALDELEKAGLLDTRDAGNTGDARMRLPGLVRAHAGRCARRAGDEGGEGRVVSEGGQVESADGELRILRWYLRQAQRADLAAAGPRLRLAATAEPVPGAPDVRFGAGSGADDGPQDHASVRQSALRWLEAERHALLDCVGLAHRRGLDAETTALCEALWTHFLDHPHYADHTDAFRAGLASAQRAEDIRGTIRMRCQLARPLWESDALAEAEEQLRQALNARQALGDGDADRKLGASAVEFHGTLLSVGGNWTDAAAEFEAARTVHREIGNDYGVMLQTYRLGEAVAALGEHERAAALLGEARRAAREQGRERLTARTGFALGGVLRKLGRGAEAAELYEASLTDAVHRGAERDQLRVLEALAELAQEREDPAAAAGHRTAAAAIRERRGLA